MREEIARTVKAYKRGFFFECLLGDSEWEIPYSTAKRWLNADRQSILNTFRYSSSVTYQLYTYRDILSIMSILHNGEEALEEYLMVYTYAKKKSFHIPTNYDIEMILRGFLERGAWEERLDTTDVLCRKHTLKNYNLQDVELDETTQHLAALSRALNTTLSLANIAGVCTGKTSEVKLNYVESSYLVGDFLYLVTSHYLSRYQDEKYLSRNINAGWAITSLTRSLLRRASSRFSSTIKLFNPETLYPNSLTLLGGLWLIFEGCEMADYNYDSRYQFFERKLPYLSKFLSLFDIDFETMVIDDLCLNITVSDLVFQHTRPTLMLFKDVSDNTEKLRANVLGSESVVKLLHNLERICHLEWEESLIKISPMFAFMVIVWYYAIYGTSVTRVEKRPPVFEVKIGSISYDIPFESIDYLFDTLQLRDSYFSRKYNVRRSFFGLFHDQFVVFKNLFGIQLPEKWWHSRIKCDDDSLNVDWIKNVRVKNSRQSRLKSEILNGGRYFHDYAFASLGE
uniref:Coat protein-like protein n=1 Tax=Blueberry virus A TaxID=1206566 RepID=T1YUW5_9CLOS|nr:coat protein-like protein [Blueberry virus A]